MNTKNSDIKKQLIVKPKIKHRWGFNFKNKVSKIKENIKQNIPFYSVVSTLFTNIAIVGFFTYTVATSVIDKIDAKEVATIDIYPKSELVFYPPQEIVNLPVNSIERQSFLDENFRKITQNRKVYNDAGIEIGSFDKIGNYYDNTSPLIKSKYLYSIIQTYNGRLYTGGVYMNMNAYAGHSPYIILVIDELGVLHGWWGEFDSGFHKFNFNLGRVQL